MNGQVDSEPLNGLVHTAARFEISCISREQPVFNRASMTYMDNNACNILECPDSEYDMWDCRFSKS